MAGELSQRVVEALLDERVHLLICINLLENSDAKVSPAAHDLAKHLRTLDEEIDRLRCEAAPGWRIRSIRKVRSRG
jgi:hypothetical protein